jgi:hypothetical protein
MDSTTFVVSNAGTRDVADLRKTNKDILDYLGMLDGTVDEPTIRSSVEGRNDVKSRALRELVFEGSILRSGSGKRGDPYLYAISRTLVPDISWGREKRDTKVDEKARNDGVYSRPPLLDEDRSLSPPNSGQISDESVDAWLVYEEEHRAELELEHSLQAQARL